MLSSYADESGHSKDPGCRFVSLAGFVGSDDEWTAFERDWKSAVDEFINGEELHMKNFGRSPIYKGWSQDKKDVFMTRLISAITDSGVDAVGCVVSLDAFEMLPPEFRNSSKDPYYMAFQEVTKGLALKGSPIMSDDFIPDPVAMVYARQKAYGTTEAGRAYQLWHIIKDNPELFTWAEWMGTYTSASPKDLLPLQAADLFAYELTREFEGWKTVDPPPMRIGLRKLLQGVKWPPLIKLYTLPVMLDMYRNSGMLPVSQEEFDPVTKQAYFQMYMVDNLLKERANA